MKPTFCYWPWKNSSWIKFSNENSSWEECVRVPEVWMFACPTMIGWFIFSVDMLEELISDSIPHKYIFFSLQGIVPFSIFLLNSTGCLQFKWYLFIFLWTKYENVFMTLYLFFMYGRRCSRRLFHKSNAQSGLFTQTF